MPAGLSAWRLTENNCAAVTEKYWRPVGESRMLTDRIPRDLASSLSLSLSLSLDIRSIDRRWKEKHQRLFCGVFVG